MEFHFDPGDAAFVEDPYPVYKVLRDEAPVYHHKDSGFYFVTRYEDVAGVLQDYSTFSSSRGNAITDSPMRVGKTLGSTDPPRHDELRRVVMKGFTPARIQERQPAIEAHVKRVLAEVKDRGECEFMSAVSRPILYGALGRMLGLEGPVADRAAELSRELFHSGGGPLGLALATDLMKGVFDLLREQLDRRKTRRSDDLFSQLLDAQDNGSGMTDDEILGNMSTVLLAGNASIGHFFSNVMYALWRNPDQRRNLNADPSKMEAAIEECVRWDTSTQAFGRQTLRDVHIRGSIIPADSRVVVCYGAANRDERAIQDPDRFDIDRPRARHFGFGYGPHICLGANTARSMLKTILLTLLPAIKDYEIDLSRSERVNHMMVRGFYSLSMRWGH
ncbi:cytochrome P450 [Bradyrhizobium sp. WSM2254]|uniref:cytochrome P450 n=1 Tax=Bradyrhizobium sp. WSM2254 TaxID=1188263 RepID=UPI0004003CDE|nr:cytochrome P450 [Bradyrhizobium sp. WSM2254]